MSSRYGHVRSQRSGLQQRKLSMSIGLIKRLFSNSTDGVEPPLHSSAQMDAWTDADLTRVAREARQALEQRRLKNCLSLSKILLQADPTNEEACALESSVRSAIQQDLEHAQALLEDAQYAVNPKVFGRGAEIILRRILNVDPDFEEAKALLSKVNAPPDAFKSPGLEPGEPDEPATEASSEIQTDTIDAPLSLDPEQQQTSPEGTEPDEVDSLPSFTVLTTGKPADASAVKRSFFLQPAPITFVILIAVAGLLIAKVHPVGQRERDIASAPAWPGETPASPVTTADIVDQTSSPPDAVPLARDPLPATTLNPDPGAAGSPLPPSVTTSSSPPPQPSRKQAPARVSSATGKLALSSRIPVEIYSDNQYLGSTPVTLELPAGPHKLEYRHDNLRKIATEVIRPDKTGTVSITFEVTVEINARPWARVFLAGAENRSLGETPLSGVSVPVGSTLLFENPNFPKKSYRVNGSDTAITVAFP